MIRKIFVPVVLCVFLSSCNGVFLALSNKGGGENDQNRIVISFDNNGGSTEANPKKKYISSGSVFDIDTLPSPPKRSGYKFSAWNTEADGSGTLFPEAVPVKKSCTVYAQWEKISAN